MQEMVRPCYLDVDLTPRMKKLWWYPYAGNFAAMAAFTEFIHASSLLRRLSAALKSIPALLHRRR
jgi:hypothetical protein